jgi:hypothetical protein
MNWSPPLVPFPSLLFITTLFVHLFFDIARLIKYQISEILDMQKIIVVVRSKLYASPEHILVFVHFQENFLSLRSSYAPTPYRLPSPLPSLTAVLGVSTRRPVIRISLNLKFFLQMSRLQPSCFRVVRKVLDLNGRLIPRPGGCRLYRH